VVKTVYSETTDAPAKSLSSFHGPLLTLLLEMVFSVWTIEKPLDGKAQDESLGDACAANHKKVRGLESDYCASSCLQRLLNTPLHVEQSMKLVLVNMTSKRQAHQSGN